MSSFTNADALQLWVIVMGVAVTIAGLSLGAIVAYLWKHRPDKKDPLRQTKVQMRLSELADAANLHPRDSV